MSILGKCTRMIQIQPKIRFSNFCLTTAPWLADSRETASPRTSRLKHTDQSTFDLVIRVKHVWHFRGRHGASGLRHYTHAGANPSRTREFNTGDGQHLSFCLRRRRPARRSGHRMGDRRFFEIPDTYVTGDRENSEGRVTSAHSTTSKDASTY